MSNRILLVEDDQSFGAVLKDYLSINNFEVTLATDGEMGLKEFTEKEFDICIFDVMMPKKDGFSLAEDVKKIDKNTPIIFLTARNMREDILKGYQIGADDYITKPFKLGVLISRINALLRRATNFRTSDTEIKSNGIKVLLLQGQVYKDGQLLDLTTAEYRLLCLLMQNPNIILSKEKILDKLWDGEGNYVDDNTLAVYVRRLRMKIENNPSNPQMLVTVRFMGYKWNV